MMTSSLDPLRRRFLGMAGAPDAFEHRARGYRTMHSASGGNDAFPLIAAFGALWARGFLRRAMQAGGVLAAADLHRGERAARWRRLNDFADAFRSLHQRVFAESAMVQRLAGDPALTSIATRALPRDLLTGLRRAGDAARDGAAASEGERVALFDMLFRWEQEQAVGPRVIDAFAAVDWPLMTAVARRPIVRFGYFPVTTVLRFTDFTNMEERVAQGRRAYVIAAACGWDATRDRLDAELARLDWTPATIRAAGCPLAGWLSPTPS